MLVLCLELTDDLSDAHILNILFAPFAEIVPNF